MEKIRARLAVSFSAKVLVPVVAVMVLLMAITVGTVNQRMTQQFEKEAAHSLATADKVFRHSHVSHTEELRLRYRNVSREPRYRAAFQTADEPRTPPAKTPIATPNPIATPIQYQPPTARQCR